MAVKAMRIVWIVRRCRLQRVANLVVDNPHQDALRG